MSKTSITFDLRMSKTSITFAPQKLKQQDYGSNTTDIQ